MIFLPTCSPKFTATQAPARFLKSDAKLVILRSGTRRFEKKRRLSQAMVLVSQQKMLECRHRLRLISAEVGVREHHEGKGECNAVCESFVNSCSCLFTSQLEQTLLSILRITTTSNYNSTSPQWHFHDSPGTVTKTSSSTCFREASLLWLLASQTGVAVRIASPSSIPSLTLSRKT